MEPKKTDEREHKKKKQELRKGLLSFLKKLRAACKEFDSLGDWEKLVQPLQDLLEKYADELSPAAAQAFQDAMRIKDVTKEGIEASCKLLDKEIEKTILILPAAAPIGTILIGALIVVAVAIPLVYGLVSATSREVTITNTNCGDFQLYPGGLNLLGLHLPENIANNHQETARVPGFLSMDVDVESSGMTLWFITEHHFSFDRQVQSATFNSANILGARTSINFGGRPKDELTITCQ